MVRSFITSANVSTVMSSNVQETVRSSSDLNNLRGPVLPERPLLFYGLLGRDDDTIFADVLSAS